MSYQRWSGASPLLCLVRGGIEQGRTMDRIRCWGRVGEIQKVSLSHTYGSVG